MTNPKPVTIMLDRERTLQYDYNALAEAEVKIGRPIWQLSPRRSGISEIRALLWAALLHESPEITLREAGGLLTHDNLAAVSDAIGRALRDFFGRRDSGNGRSPGTT